MTILFFFFFFNDPATPEIYTLPLHDALPIYRRQCGDEVTRHHHRLAADAVGERPEDDEERGRQQQGNRDDDVGVGGRDVTDRKSTRLNSSHANISYAVFCLKKKKKQKVQQAK